MTRKGWHQRPHRRTSTLGNRFKAGRGEVCQLPNRFAAVGQAYRYGNQRFAPPGQPNVRVLRPQMQIDRQRPNGRQQLLLQRQQAPLVEVLSGQAQLQARPALKTTFLVGKEIKVIKHTEEVEQSQDNEQARSAFMEWIRMAYDDWKDRVQRKDWEGTRWEESGKDVKVSWKEFLTDTASSVSYGLMDADLPRGRRNQLRYMYYDSIWWSDIYSQEMEDVESVDEPTIRKVIDEMIDFLHQKNPSGWWEAMAATRMGETGNPMVSQRFKADNLKELLLKIGVSPNSGFKLFHLGPDGLAIRSGNDWFYALPSPKTYARRDWLHGAGLVKEAGGF